LFRLDRHIGHFARDIRNDLHRIADHERRPLRRAPIHRDEKADEQQQQDDRGRDFPEQVERNDLQLHQDEEDDEIDIEQDDDHRAASPLCAAGTST
jgi:hypothetical protein